jgi:hypothetical protein
MSVQQNGSQKSLNEAEGSTDAVSGHAKGGTRALSGKEGVSRGSRYQKLPQSHLAQGLAQNRGGGSVKRGINSTNVMASGQPGRLVSS